MPFGPQERWQQDKEHPLVSGGMHIALCSLTAPPRYLAAIVIGVY